MARPGLRDASCCNPRFPDSTDQVGPGHCISGPFQLPCDVHIYNACFSPDMKDILLQLKSNAVVLGIVMGEEQFWIKGWDFVFIHHDGRIAFMDWIDEDGNFIAWGDSEEQSGWPTQILVKLWGANNGFKVDDVAYTRFSLDGRFLAVGRKSESVIELWSLEYGKDPRQLLYPPGNELSSLHFSPTSDSLMAVFMEKPGHIYSLLTNYLVIKRCYTLEIWDVHDWLKTDLEGKSSNTECLSITRWPRAFSWI